MVTAKRAAKSDISNSNLLECIGAVERDATLTHAIRVRLIGAARTAAKILGRAEGSHFPKPLSTISADADGLHEKLQTAPYGACGISRRYAGNIVADVVRVCGYGGKATRRRAPISAEWREILIALPRNRAWSYFQPLLRELTDRKVQPSDLTYEALNAALISAFSCFDEVEGRQQKKRAIKAWNRARIAISAWPQFELHYEPRQRWSPMPWEELSENIREPIAGYFFGRVNRDLRSTRRVRLLGENSSKKAKEYVRHLVTAMRDSGVEIERLTIATLVDPDNVDRAISQTAQRLDKDRSDLMANMVVTAMAIGRDFGALDARGKAELQAILSNSKPERRGISDKNQRQLDQFRNPKVRARLLALPNQMMHEAYRKKSKHAGARKAAIAIAMDIALTCHLRGANIAMIRQDKHVQRSEHGARLCFSAAETKARRPITKLLRDETFAMLRSYMHDFHQVLAPDGSSFIFPNECDATRPKSPDSLMNAVATEVRRALGVEFHSHLFRHLASLFIEEVSPEDAHILGPVLGHAPDSTATDAYRDSENGNAQRRMQEIFAEDFRRLTAKRKPTRVRQAEGEHT
jgi:integrase